MRHYEKHAPGLLKTLKDNYWHRSIGTQQKIVVIRTLMNRYNVKQWTRGAVLIVLNLEHGYLTASCKAVAGSRRTYKDKDERLYNMLSLLQSSLEIKDTVMRDAELFSPLAWPMLIEPNDWENDRQGGYILNEVMRGHDMVRRGDPTLYREINRWSF